MRRVFAATLAFAAMTSTALAGGVSVPMDEVRTVTFAKPITTVYVGNPTIADINMIDSRHAFLLGKSFGMTNIIALDAEGREVANTPVSVSGGHHGSTVTLTKGTAQTTLACSTDRCQPTPQPGDAHFNELVSDIEKHMDLGTKTAQ